MDKIILIKGLKWSIGEINKEIKELRNQKITLNLRLKNLEKDYLLMKIQNMKELGENGKFKNI